MIFTVVFEIKNIELNWIDYMVFGAAAAKCGCDLHVADPIYDPATHSADIYVQLFTSWFFS